MSLLRQALVRLFSAVLLLAPGGLAHAGPTEDVARGNEAFYAGDFAAAAVAYRAALEGGADGADVYYNLGTTEAEAGRYGPAIWAFEQALLIRPGDDDVAHNLAQVRSAIVTAALEGGSDRRVILPGDDDFETGLFTALSPTTATWAFAGCWVALFGLLALARRTPDAGRRTALTFAAVVVALAALAAGGLLVGRLLVVQNTEYAIVLADDATVLSGPLPRAARVARVRPGVRVRVLGADAEMRRIALPDGSDGWLPADALGVLQMR